MLRIELVNDGTEEDMSEIIGHYDYIVYVNDEPIAKGHLKNFNRLTGWKGLVSYLGRDLFADPGDVGGECESLLWEKNA